MASALLEVAMQSVFQKKCSYTMAVRGLLDVGSVMVRRMRAFAVANEMKPQAGDDLRVPIGISYVMPRGHMFQSRAQRWIYGTGTCIREIQLSERYYEVAFVFRRNTRLCE